jgi:hypothetical protein
MLHQTVQRLIVMVTFSAFIAAVIWLAAFMPSAHLANIDYARFWYVGERLLIAVAPALSPTDMHALAAWHPLDLLSQTAGFQVWLYPPTLNNLAILFAILPLRVSLAAWDIITVLFGAWLLRRAGLTGAEIILGLASSSDLISVLNGQTGSLLGALLVSSLLLIDKRPRSAGLCAGCLSLKPQIGLALVAILPLRHRSVPTFLMAVAALLFVSLSLQGLGLWLWFFNVAGPTATRFLAAPWRYTFVDGSISVFMMARSFGAGVDLAWALQAVVSMAALCATAYIWRLGSVDNRRRMAVTVSLSVLVMPYGYIYDMTGFGIAMAVMLLASSGMMRGVFAILWLASGFNFLTMDVLDHPLFPLVAAAGALSCWPLRDRARRPGIEPPLLEAMRLD